MKNKTCKTCNTCVKRGSCQTLCEDMLEILKNSKYKNNLYSENSFRTNTMLFDIKTLEKGIYTYGMCEAEIRDTKRIIIALLNEEQKNILDLYIKGYSQKEIANIFKVSQSNISKRIRVIKNEIKKSLVFILPYIT